MSCDEQGRAEERAAPQQEFLAQLAEMEVGGVGIALVDRQGAILSANRRAEEILGLTKDGGNACDPPASQVVGANGAPPSDWLHPVLGVIRSGQPARDVRLTVQSPDGRRASVSINAMPFRDNSGRVERVLATIADVTERQQADEAIQACRRRYQKLLAAVTTYVYSVELRDGVSIETQHSLGSVSTTGYTPGDFALDPELWISMVHPDDREMVRAHVAKVLAGEPVPPIEHRILRKDGKERWVRDTIVEHFDDRGALVRYDGLVEDITQRRSAEDRFRRLLEAAPDGMVVVDRDGRIVLVNEQTERLFGYLRAELVGQVVEVLIPERFREQHVHQRDGYVARPRIRPLQSGLDLRGRRKDASEFPLQIALSPLETEEGVLVLAAVRDVTEHRRMDEQLERNLQIQRAVSSLLRDLLEPISLNEQLERTLDLLFSIPWIALEPRGAVFLVEEDPTKLVMKASRGMCDELLATCGTVPIGECLCGRSGASRDVVFASHVDEDHDRRYPDMEPHGHYCVPIISGDRLFGVINVYVEAGHDRNATEEAFLMAVADALAGAIQRRQAEEDLRKSEERFDLAVRGTDAGIWDWVLRSGRVYFSARWKSMLGYQEHEIGGRFSEWESRLHPDDHDRALATLNEYLEGKSTEYQLEHRLRHKDGSYRWILARGAAVRDPERKPYRMVGSHIDITELKRTEEALKHRDAQLLAAQRIQEALLPRQSPLLPGFEIHGAMLPAEFTAGDYFDYLVMPGGSLGFVIGDVSGHGFGPALVTASAHSLFHSLAQTQPDVGQVLLSANRFLAKETEEGRFITLLLARLDPASRSLAYANAGHPSGYVLDGAGRVKARLESGALPLAVLPDTEFPIGGPIALEPGDTVLLLTDGVCEAMSYDGTLFGERRVVEVVAANRTRSAREIIDELFEAVRSYSQREKPTDDITAVVIKVLPDADGAASHGAG